MKRGTQLHIDFDGKCFLVWPRGIGMSRERTFKNSPDNINGRPIFFMAQNKFTICIGTGDLDKANSGLWPSAVATVFYFSQGYVFRMFRAFPCCLSLFTRIVRSVPRNIAFVVFYVENIFIEGRLTLSLPGND